MRTLLHYLLWLEDPGGLDGEDERVLLLPNVYEPLHKANNSEPR